MSDVNPSILARSFSCLTAFIASIVALSERAARRADASHSDSAAAAPNVVIGGVTLSVSEAARGETQLVRSLVVTCCTPLLASLALATARFTTDEAVQAMLKAFQVGNTPSTELPPAPAPRQRVDTFTPEWSTGLGKRPLHAPEHRGYARGLAVGCGAQALDLPARSPTPNEFPPPASPLIPNHGAIGAHRAAHAILRTRMTATHSSGLP